MNQNSNDCDIFEVAEELYQTLELAYDTLNQIPYGHINMHGKRTDTYNITAQIFHVLQEYKERI